MSNKTLKIFSFIPVLNLFVIVYCFVKSYKVNKSKKMIKSVFIWALIMVGVAIVRAIVTIIFSALNMSLVVNIFTYASLYGSISAGALLCCHTLNN